MSSSATTNGRHIAVGPSAEHALAIAEIHGDIAWIIDCASGRPTYISPSACSLSGYGMDEILRQFEGDPVFSVAGSLGAICAGLGERLRRYEKGDQSRRRLQRSFDLTRPDGRSVPVEVTSNILDGSDGKAQVLVGTVRNVSAAREAEAQQRRFTSMINHEFRTPLSTIDGAIQRLEATGSGADDATRDRYRKIQAAVDRLIGMMDEYLSPDRMAAAGAARAASTASPAVLLEEAAALVRAAGRPVSIQIGDLPALVRCQPAGIRLALRALVDNAVRYSRPDAAISVRGELARGGVALLVRDGGAGVPEAELTAIFGKSYRGSNASGTGSGLGLYMARSVVEVHGGKITVRNVPPAGAEFCIWLPAPAAGGKELRRE